jgi:hypothetical protein
MERMDLWGVEGCKRNRELAIRWLREGAPRWGWRERIAIAAKAVRTGLAFKLDPRDPYPGLVDEAIHREEQRQLKSAA